MKSAVIFGKSPPEPITRTISARMTPEVVDGTVRLKKYMKYIGVVYSTNSLGKRIAVLVAVCFVAFLGVAQRRANTGKKVWTHETLLYTLLAAAVTLYALHLLCIRP